MPAQKILVNEELILKYKDIFHLKNLYVFCKEWAMENEYSDMQNNNPAKVSEKFYEKYYLEKVDNSGREIWWWWEMKKDISNYIRYYILTSAHCLAIKNTEIIHEGKKYKTQVGEVEFKWYGWLIMDPHDKWKNHPILSHFDNIFRKRIMKKNIDLHEEELRRDIYRYQGAVKRHLELKEFLPPETPFFPKKGVW